MTATTRRHVDRVGGLEATLIGYGEAGTVGAVIVVLGAVGVLVLTRGPAIPVHHVAV